MHNVVGECKYGHPEPESQAAAAGREPVQLFAADDGMGEMLSVQDRASTADPRGQGLVSGRGWLVELL